MTGPPAPRRLARWDQPFDAGMTEGDVDRLLALPLFADMEADRFPRNIPLRGILRNDARKVRYQPGEIVIREGDYGTSAFVILGGGVRVILKSETRFAPGRTERRRVGFLEALASPFLGRPTPEARDLRPASERTGLMTRGVGTETRVYVPDVTGLIERSETVPLAGVGDLFGEMAALGRTDRSATVVAETELELLEIRHPGLRDLRKYDARFGARVDGLYRDRSLVTRLKATPIFSHLADEELAAVAEAAEWHSHGRFDWDVELKKREALGWDERLSDEPIVVLQGDYVNGVTVIANGFGRVSRSFGNSEHTLEYLGRGRVFGLEELTHHWRTGEPEPHGTTLRALGYLETLFVPSALVEKYVLGPDRSRPRAKPSLIPSASGAEKGRGRGRSRLPVLPNEALELLVDERVHIGAAAMVIDMDRCTRCDDCVRACSDAHDGNPRFLRSGPRIGPLMVASACMHCADPVCMIGCPTAAISRDKATGNILIDDNTCVGCGTCASSCPWDNIRMVEIRDTSGEVIRDLELHEPIRKATKCDLCIDEWGGPACQRACPHDALVRVDLSQGPERLAQWLDR